jgi:hypothetical protein
MTAEDREWIRDQIQTAILADRERTAAAAAMASGGVKLNGCEAPDIMADFAHRLRVTDPIPHSTAWHCANCKKPMQFFDGICFECNGGRDPGD